MAGKYPQESYSVVVQALQSECILFQYMTKDRVHTFAGVKELLQETFLHCLFFVNSKSLTSIVGTMIMVPVNKSGLGLQDPVTLANKKYLSLIHARCELIGAVKG